MPRREPGSLAAALGNRSRDAAQDVDLLDPELGPMREPVQARHQLLRRRRVEEAERLQRFLPVPDDPAHGDGIGALRIGRRRGGGESAARLAPVVGDELQRLGEVERAVSGIGRDREAGVAGVDVVVGVIADADAFVAGRT